MGERAQALRAPVLVEPVQRAIHLLQRLPPLRRRLGRHEIGDALGLGEVELAVLEGAARELAGLGQAAEAQLGKGVERCARRRRGRHGGGIRPSVSPVSVLGAANQTTRPLSKASPVAGSTRVRRAMRRGVGKGFRVSDTSASPARGPLSLMTANAPGCARVGVGVPSA